MRTKNVKGFFFNGATDGQFKAKIRAIVCVNYLMVSGDMDRADAQKLFYFCGKNYAKCFSSIF